MFFANMFVHPLLLNIIATNVFSYRVASTNIYVLGLSKVHITVLLTAEKLTISLLNNKMEAEQRIRLLVNV